MSRFCHRAIWHVKRFIKAVLRRLGFRLVRLAAADLRVLEPAKYVPESVPANLRATLTSDHPRLRELRKRYARVTGPIAQRTMWDPTYVAHEVQLPYFRADNAYVWQYRTGTEDVRRRHYLLARYVAERDPRGLLARLGEDGAFGCGAFDFPNLPTVSRDLLDSVNEMYFLERAMGLFGRTGLKVLDIGAGYGRLAHRMAAAVPGLAEYWCVDAIPESTFLSEIYLDYRGCRSKARVVPLDEITDALVGKAFDLVLNIHSFSEMGLDAIQGWLDLVAGCGVPNLLIVPNHMSELRSREANGRMRDFLPAVLARGYRLVAREPVVRDPDFRNWLWLRDQFFFFQR